MVIRFVRSCMYVLFASIYCRGIFLRFSTFPNILTGVGCIYSFFFFATTPLYHGHFEFFNPRSGGFLAGNLFQILPHYLSTWLLITFS
jgi:hypothetical protein